jgi:hypothetical protein
MAEVISQGSFIPDNLIGGSNELLVTEEILVAAGQNLVRGSVMGRVKVSVPTTGTLAGTGDGTCTAVSGGAKTKQGAYLVTCVVVPVTHGGTFRVTNPDGQDIGYFTMPNTAGATYVFKSPEINFTLTDGATNFDLTSIFTVTVTEGVPNTGSLTPIGTANGTMTGVEGRRHLKVGTYTVTCITAVANGGIFSVVDPDSLALPNATVGTAYESDQIAFLINDGGNDFVVGDVFTVAVTINPRQVKLLDKTAGDGSSEPYCVLSEDVDATSAAEYSIGYLQGQFNERSLVFASGTDLEDVRDQMIAKNMYPVASVARGN